LGTWLGQPMGFGRRNFSRDGILVVSGVLKPLAYLATHTS
jgi:hypothetical protein